MSFLSKLFHKDENKAHQNENKTPEKIRIETEFATFIHIDNAPVEVGYEAELNWYDVPEDEMERLNYYPVGCYIDCNTPETTDASICLERITRLFEDRYRTDFQVKNTVAQHFTGDNGLIKTLGGEMMTKQELIDELEIRFISVYRDGRTAYSLNQYSLDIDYSSDVHIIFDKDNNYTVQNDREFYNFQQR
ncbi:MAG: hypothetical protein J6I46_00190 [Ruminococcus sp.]|nr:hypothetical protein [Ruminococcus sp.]